MASADQNKYIENNEKIDHALKLFEKGMALIKEVKDSYIEIANAPEIQQPFYVDVKEAARLLSVSDRTVVRMANSKKLPSYKFEGATRYRRIDLENLLPMV